MEMTKKYCDRCGKEIIEKDWFEKKFDIEVSIHEFDTNIIPKIKEEFVTGVTIIKYGKINRKNKYDLCSDCKKEFEKFIKNKL